MWRNVGRHRIAIENGAFVVCFVLYIIAVVWFVTQDEPPRNELLNGDFQQGIRYWKPFHWFGKQEIHTTEFSMSTVYYLTLSLPNLGNAGPASESLRFGGIFQFVELWPPSPNFVEENQDLEEENKKKILEKKEIEKDLSPESSPQMPHFVSLSFYIRREKSPFLTGSFRAIVRGKTVDGNFLKEIEWKENLENIKEEIWQPHCITFTVDRPIYYIAVYFLLEGREETAFSISNILLEHRFITMNQVGDFAELVTQIEGEPKKADLHSSSLLVPYLEPPDDQLHTVPIDQMPQTCAHRMFKSNVDYQQFNAFKKHAFFHQASSIEKDSLERPDITIATQCSADRLDSLLELHQLWRGPLSVVLYVRDLSDIIRVEELRLATPYIEEWVDFHFFYANDQDEPYPVNALRAFAVKHVRTMYHISLDTDFLPRPGLREYLRTFLAGTIHVEAGNALSGSSFVIENGYAYTDAKRVKNKEEGTQVAFIVPSFEVDGLHASNQVPRHKKDIARFVRAAKARPLHAHLRPESHAPTDFKRWFSTTQVYEVAYMNHYEPFLLALSDISTFDERFRGYGFDRSSQVYEHARRGGKMVVLNDAFIVHADHEASHWKSSQTLPGFQLVWQNVYEFLYEIEISKPNPTQDISFAQLYDSKFDFLDFQDWTALQALERYPSSSKGWFLVTPFKFVLLGLMMLIIFRRIFKGVALTSHRHAIDFIRKKL